MYIKSKNKTT